MVGGILQNPATGFIAIESQGRASAVPRAAMQLLAYIAELNQTTEAATVAGVLIYLCH